MKTIFWCADCQNDFFKNGKFIIASEEIRPNIKKITNYAKNNNIKVVSTGDYHTMISKEISKFPDLKNTFPEHCMAGNDGMEFIPETEPEDGTIIVDYTESDFPIEAINKSRNIILYKDHKNIFDDDAGNPWALNTIALLNPDTVIVYGINIDSVVVGLIDELCTVIIIKDAISGEEQYKKWRDAGAKLIDTKTLLEAGVK